MNMSNIMFDVARSSTYGDIEMFCSSIFPSTLPSGRRE